MAGSYLYIWFVFYVSLPNEIKLLLFNIFFFGQNLSLDEYPVSKTVSSSSYNLEFTQYNSLIFLEIIKDMFSELN